jgi:hypothetical protein
LNWSEDSFIFIIIHAFESKHCQVFISTIVSIPFFDPIAICKVFSCFCNTRNKLEIRICSNRHNGTSICSTCEFEQYIVGTCTWELTAVINCCPFIRRDKEVCIRVPINILEISVRQFYWCSVIGSKIINSEYSLIFSAPSCPWFEVYEWYILIEWLTSERCISFYFPLRKDWWSLNNCRFVMISKAGRHYSVFLGTTRVPTGHAYILFVTVTCFSFSIEFNVY